MRTNNKGVELIMHFESLHDGDLSKIGCQPKMDPVGIWTIGYGHALWNPAKKTWYRGPKDKAAVYALYPALSHEDCLALLRTDLPRYEAAVLGMVKRRDFTEDQFSALVSFCYNCGTGYNSKTSGKFIPFKLWELVDNYASGQELFDYWEDSVVTAAGKFLPGLQRRRRAEAVLYLEGRLDLSSQPRLRSA